MKWTLLPLQRLSPWTHRALREVSLWHAGETGEVIVTSCTEVGGSEAEEHGNRAAIAALVLEEVSAVLMAHLQGGRRGRGRDKGVVLVDTLPLVPHTNTHTHHSYPKLTWAAVTSEHPPHTSSFGS